MHPNSKIFDFVNLTAEIIDYPKLSFLIFSISRFLCLFLVIQFSRYFTYTNLLVCGGLGRTRTSDLTLIRRAL